MAKYASKVVKQAQSWLGYNEYDGTHKKIIDVYNSQSKLPRYYPVKYTDQWCATFVSAVSVKLGYTDIMPAECSCNYMIELYKKLGRWVENESTVPKAGWIIFYDWEDSGVGDNRGSSDHVGIVEKVSGDTIVVIEGNYSKSVKRRNIAVNGKYVRGYGVPKYDAEKNVLNTVVKNNKIDTVIEVQTWLNSNYSSGIAEDNVYGKQTKAALVKALQKELGFTGSYVDGIYGKQTNAKVKTLKKGSKGNLVKILQALLVCNGYKDTYINGNFGTGTKSAVLSFQKKNNIVVDGIAGQQTFTELCS
jgi:hypothetical protein